VRSLPSVIRLVRRSPETIFVLDHAGKPEIQNRREQRWRACIETLAKMPNVFCKISGLSTEADRKDWKKEDLKPYIDHAIEIFGWDRVIFGTDWPVCNLAGGLESWLEAALWATSSASEANRLKLFAGNARRVYRLAV
jgi:L-fuconolactonase